MNDRINWIVPVLSVVVILEIIYFFSVLLGLNNLTFVGFGGWFLFGVAIGYIIWLLL